MGIVRTVDSGPLRFSFRASPLTNLVHQLDSMAGLVRTPPPVFRARWAEAPLAWTARDERVLGRWRAIQERYRRTLQTGTDEPWTGDLPPPREDEIELSKKLRIAAFEADDVAAYRDRLSLITTPRDATALAAIVAHFLPRFTRYWDAELEGPASALAQGFATLLEDRRLVGFVERVAAFYDAVLPPEHTLRFHLLLRNDRGGHGLQGEQVEDHSLVEIFPSQAPSERVDVALHELFHHLYWSASRQRHLALLRAFTTSDKPHAIAGYNLLDESVAAALGNGLVAKAIMGDEEFATFVAKPGSLYGSSAIDRLAKELIPVVEQTLEAGGSLDEGFAVKYLGAFERALKSGVLCPDLLLSTMALAHDGDRMRAPVVSFLDAMKARNVYGRSPTASPGARAIFERYPELSGAIFVHTADVGRLDAWGGLLGANAPAEIVKLAAGRRAFVYGARRSPRAWIFVFVGRDNIALEGAVQSFIHAKTPFAGVLDDW